jgi:hypothetical protein
VTLENCKITSDSFMVVNIAAGVTGAIVQNCEINGVGVGNAGSVGINGQGTFIGNNIYNVENGINVTGSSVIEDNYIHNLKASGSPHYDGIQIDGGVSNIAISHNTVIAGSGSVSAIMIDNYWGPISNISVDDNLLVGGGFTVYDDAHFNSNAISGVSFTNNHMGSGGYGVTNFNGTNPTYTGNVNDGAALAATLNTSGNTGGGTTAPPVQPTPNAPVISSGNHVTSDNTVTLNGTALAGSTVTIYDGATKLGTTTVASSGVWSYTTAALADGKHSLTATDTSSGKTSVASSAASITVDTHAPVAPVLVSDTVVNTNQVLLSGTAEANSTIKVYDGSTAIGTATAGSNGAWSMTTGALSTGSHVLSATATDTAGNTSVLAQGLNAVIASPTPPSAVAKIVSYSNDTGVTNDGITSDNTLTFVGTGAAGTTVTVFDGTTKLGTATVNGSGAWSYTTTALSDGRHSFTVTDTTPAKSGAASLAAVTSTSSSATAITIDTHAPTAPVLTATSLVDTNHVLVSGTAEANSTIKVYDGATVVGTAVTGSNGAWAVTTGALTAGAHVLTATAADTAGNTSAQSAGLHPVIGSPAPSAPTIVSYSKDTGIGDDHITSDNTLTLAGTAAANTKVTVFDGTTKLGTASVNGSGAWSYTTGVLSDGNHSLTAIDTDASGHASSASSALAVNVDTHAPAAPTLAVYTTAGAAVGATTTADAFLLKGTAEANSTVSVFDGGKQVGTATANSGGLWSFATDHEADGSHSFTVNAADAAGNTSAASAAKVVLVDSPSAAHTVGITNLFETDGSIVTVKGIADAFSQVKIFDGNTVVGTVSAGSSGAWSYTTSSAVSNSVHTYKAQELDSNGHAVATSGAAILGSTGANTLTSTAGNDLFVGNGHPDTFLFSSNFGNDVIKDFNANGWSRGHDVIQFSKSVFDNFADVLSHATQSGQNVVIKDSAGDSLTLMNVKLSALDKHDFHFA